jgi:predicted DNA-binding protein
MPTLKKRLNITLPDEMRIYLKKLAVKDGVPEATKAAELLRMALEIEEDTYFATIADVRAQKRGKAVSHEIFWEKVL